MPTGAAAPRDPGDPSDPSDPSNTGTGTGTGTGTTILPFAVFAPLFLLIIALAFIGANTTAHELDACRVQSVSEPTGGRPAHREIVFSGCAEPVLDRVVQAKGDFRREPPRVGGVYDVTVLQSPLGTLQLRDAELSAE